MARCAAGQPSWLGIATLLLAVVAGCTRAQYRRQADQEVAGLVGRAAGDPRWRLRDYTIQPAPQSRMFDPNCPDFEPMPPDDPTSHRLMHCVDCKRGWCWHSRYGRTGRVENPGWQRFLPCDAQGNVVLDRPAAVQVALLNSPEYQRALEDVYLSALDVTFQRFRFDAQFFGTHSTFFTADGARRSGGGGQSSSTLEVGDSLAMHKLSATGGQLVVDVANSLVWQFAGPDTYSAATLLDFSLVQPLLRGAGRAVVLENLTQSERTLLANIRQMARFRQAFYAFVISGRSAAPGPQRGVLGIEAVFPPSFSATGGLFSLMAEQVRIRNQRFNVAKLRESLRRFEEINRAGRVNQFQVELTRQALFNAQSRLLAIVAANQDRLDAFKIALGLPPCLEVRIADPLLAQFNLIDPRLTAMQDAANDVLGQLREPQPGTAPALRKAAETSRREIAAVLAMVENDLAAMDKALPRRRADLERLSARPEVQSGDVDPSATSVAGLEQRVADLRRDFARQQQDLLRTQAALERFAARTAAPDETARAELVALVDDLAILLGSLSVTQAGARLETATLVPISLGPQEAFKIACEHRLDWMNARAALVDAWRQIEITANALRAGLSVTLSGDISTVGNNPLRFRGTTGRLRTGLQFDAPLTRLAERNAYREALIDYQRARRAYYTFEDRVSQVLRDNLRTIETAQLDFELRRAGVRVAIRQVDLAQEKLKEPLRPGEQAKPLSDTAARDLVQALSGLLSAQNDFLNQWIDYEALRLNLDLDLGTMQLDCHGMWIDPGAIEAR